MKNILTIWTRVGDSADYGSFGQDLDALAQNLYECGVRLPIHQTMVGHGIIADGFEEANYVSLYWGDDKGNFVQSFNVTQIRELRRLLKLQESD